MITNATVAKLSATVLLCALSIAPSRAGAIEVKKSLYANPGAAGGAGGPAAKNPFTPELRQRLSETVASESDTYVAAESEKKATGQVYTDLESAKFKYFPSASGKVQAKLEAAEYKANKAGKPVATGRKRTLVFSYKLEGSKWTETEQPKWEEEKAEAAKK